MAFNLDSAEVHDWKFDLSRFRESVRLYILSAFEALLTAVSSVFTFAKDVVYHVATMALFIAINSMLARFNFTELTAAVYDRQQTTE